MNNPNLQLKDLIHVERGFIPSKLCDYLVDTIEKNEWSPHFWYNNVQETLVSEESMELDVQTTTIDNQSLISPYIIQAGELYNAKYSFDYENSSGRIVHKFSPIRFNRYSPGQIMRQHYDHIHSLFDGNDKGIPVLSFIFNLNDDYEGAELFFWDDYIIPLGKGDTVVFPSLFLFPHGVKEPTKGKRYSAVSWSW